MYMIAAISMAFLIFLGEFKAVTGLILIPLYLLTPINLQTDIRYVVICALEVKL